MSRAGQSAPLSRLSKTNPADREDSRERPGNRRFGSVPLTERDGVSLRTEVTEATAEGIDAIPWQWATSRWANYIEDSRDSAAVFEDSAGRRVEGSDPNRFMPGYADKQYAKLKDLERGIRDEYGKRLHTAMLTFTASSTDDEGRPLPPVDHLDGPEGLLSSWSAVTRELRRVMEGRRYERLAILEPHESGYLHIHMAVFVDGRVTRETFRPVVEAHLRNCGRAGREAHDLEDDTTVSVRHAGKDRDLESDGLDEIAIYLAEYLGTYSGDPLDAPKHQQRANAVLWATGKQRWRPSNGAQEYMATNRGKGEDPHDWEIVAFRDGDGELHELDEPPAGGVDRRETCTDVPGPPLNS